MDFMKVKCAFAVGGCCEKVVVTRSSDMKVDLTSNWNRDGTPGRVSVGSPISGKMISRVGMNKRKYEKLWRDLVSDPSQWWDNRTEKQSPRFPDFKHKQTGEGLWVIDGRNPPWVAAEIASIAPGANILSCTKRLSKHNKAGQFKETLERFEEMQKDGIPSDGYIFVHVLNACAALQNLTEGRRIHKQIIETGYELNVYVSSSLVDLYAKCGSIDDAWTVFNKMPTRDVVSWSTMIQGCVKCGQGLKALQLFHQMQQEGVQPNSVTFTGLVNACASIPDLDKGRQVHRQIVQSGCERDVFVSSSLVDMYAKCGSIDEARGVFEQMPTHDVVSWNAIILGSAKCGQGLKALQLFHQMHKESVQPNSVTFVGLVNACAIIADLAEGRKMHQHIVQSGCESDVYVGSSLVDMYAKCGSIEEAWGVFRQMPTQDLVGWNAMILGLVKCGQGLKALELFHEMQEKGVDPQSVTFVGVLNACASISGLEEGRQIHEHIVRSGWEEDVYVGNSLLDMYAKCGSMDDAWRVFEQMPTHDAVGWSTMIMGCVKSGQGLKAVDLHQQMQREGVEPDSVTFMGLLNACASTANLGEGRQIHQKIIGSGWECDVYVSSSLVDMYAKCGSIDEAWRVFEQIPIRNVVAWSAMILGFVKSGRGLKALELYQQMQQEGVEPDSVTFVGLLNACASVAALETGKLIHRQIIDASLEFDSYVSAALVDMYSKCGSLQDAERFFEKMPTRTVSAWTAMLMGYAIHGHARKAVAFFEQMCQADVEVNEITFICLLSACSHGCLVKEGIHYFDMMRSFYSLSPTVEHFTCMVDLLGRAGHLHDAEEMVQSMPFEPCAAAWMALLGACRIHGNVEMGQRAAEQVLKLEPKNASGYVLLSNIYADAAVGNWALVEREQRQENDVNEVVRSLAVVNDLQHAQTVKTHKEELALV